MSHNAVSGRDDRARKLFKTAQLDDESKLTSPTTKTRACKRKQRLERVELIRRKKTMLALALVEFLDVAGGDADLEPDPLEIDADYEADDGA